MRTRALTGTLRSLVLSLMLIDVGLVVGRILGLRAILTLRGFGNGLGWATLSFVAAVLVIWFTYPKFAGGYFRQPAIIGGAAGVLMIAHMALENLGARVGEDWRPTVAVMLLTFISWFASGWWGGSKYGTTIAGVVAGCWTAIISVLLAVTFGFAMLYFDVPSPDYVASWPEFAESGWSDPRAFALANALDAATSHLVTALLLGSVLGAAGGVAGSRRWLPGPDSNRRPFD